MEEEERPPIADARPMIRVGRRSTSSWGTLYSQRTVNPIWAGSKSGGVCFPVGMARQPEGSSVSDVHESTKRKPVVVAMFYLNLSNWDIRSSIFSLTSSKCYEPSVLVVYDKLATLTSTS